MNHMSIKKVYILQIIIFCLFFQIDRVHGKNYNWTGKGRLYDKRNQYFVTCRLVKEYRVKPFLGEDTVKCHYRCQDYVNKKDEFVITTHSDFACQKQVIQPRGNKRDWRGR